MSILERTIDHGVYWRRAIAALSLSESNRVRYKLSKRGYRDYRRPSLIGRDAIAHNGTLMTKIIRIVVKPKNGTDNFSVAGRYDYIFRKACRSTIEQNVKTGTEATDFLSPNKTRSRADSARDNSKPTLYFAAALLPPIRWYRNSLIHDGDSSRIWRHLERFEKHMKEISFSLFFFFSPSSERASIAMP